MGLIDSIRARKRRLICFPVDTLGRSVIYRIRPVRSEEMRRQGIATLVGPEALAAESAVEAAEAQLSAKRNDLRAALKDQPEALEAAIAEAEAEFEAAKEESAKELIKAVLADEEKLRATMSTLEAFIMGAVEAVGLAKEGVEPGVQPVGTAPAEVCEPLDEGDPPTYLEAARIVGDSEAVVPGDGKLPISELSVEERTLLGSWITAALAVTGEVRPFRPGSRAGEPD